MSRIGDKASHQSTRVASTGTLNVMAKADPVGDFNYGANRKKEKSRPGRVRKNALSQAIYDSQYKEQP